LLLKLTASAMSGLKYSFQQGYAVHSSEINFHNFQDYLILPSS